MPIIKDQSSKFIIFFLSAAILISVTGCGKNTPTADELSKLTAKAILSDNADVYCEGECCAEGHIVLGNELSDNLLKIYALTMYGNYGFRNDIFIKVSGSGIVPAVLTFEKEGTDHKLQGIEYPQDGAEYRESIKRMFPLKYHMQVLHYSESHNASLESQEKRYAEKYLKSMKRDAEIGEFSDLNAVLLTDMGVDVEVSNKLIRDERLCQYPFWVGTAEFLENRKRYVRSLSLNEAAGQIIYRTTEKETGTITELFIFDADNGEELDLPYSSQ